MVRIVCRVVDVYAFRRTAGGVEFLMLHRAPPSRCGGTWQAVHGHIRTGEKAWQAALRELHEETGLRPLRFWQLQTVNTFYLADRDEILMCPGFAAEVEPTALPVLSDENTAFRWVVADEALRTFMWPGQRQAAREILEYLVAGAPAEALLRIDPDAPPGGRT